MPRGQYARKPAVEAPTELVAIIDPPARAHAALVRALPEPDDELDEPPIADLLALSIQAANRGGDFAFAGALNGLANVLGELTRAVAALPTSHDPGLAAVLDRLKPIL